MAKLKYRVRVLLGDQELVLLVPAAPETTIGELQADVLARAQRQGVIGSACAFSVDGALLDELDSVEDVLEAEQTIDARLTPLRECSWSATDLAALVREGFSPALRHTIVETHASLAAFRRSPDGSRLIPSRVTPAKRPAPEDCVAAPAPADADESDGEEYVWPAGALRGAALIGRKVRVWWPHDRAWFSGSVNAFDGTKLYEVTYTDGSLWDEDLAERRWELLDERSLKAHEKELLRVERLIAAGELSKHQGGAAGSVYARFYELAGATAASGSRRRGAAATKALRVDVSRTRLSERRSRTARVADGQPAYSPLPSTSPHLLIASGIFRTRWRRNGKRRTFALQRPRKARASGTFKVSLFVLRKGLCHRASLRAASQQKPRAPPQPRRWTPRCWRPSART